jgi:hypothetical protein
MIFYAEVTRWQVKGTTGNEAMLALLLALAGTNQHQ